MFDMTEEDVIEFIKDFQPDDEFETTLQYERRTHIYWYFKDVRFKFKPRVCNKCSVGCIFSKLQRIEILDVKGVDYRCILCGISRNKAVNILNGSVLEDRGWINEIDPYDWF